MSFRTAFREASGKQLVLWSGNDEAALALARDNVLAIGAGPTFLILLGGVIGTGLGYWASELFIPFMQIGADATAMVPPFQVLIAWPSIIQIYMMFAALFGVTLFISVILLRRMRIFQAIKLGETV